jgi:ATP synthase I chain
MSEIVNNAGRSSAFERADPAAMERRLFRLMCATVTLSVAVSLPLAPWRTTTGLLLGGILSLFNHHWLRSSLATVFGTAQSGRRVKISAARYVLRYFVIAGVVALAYSLNLVSIVATLLGLCSFVVAAMIEAFMQIYFVIVNREET